MTEHHPSQPVDPTAGPATTPQGATTRRGLLLAGSAAAVGLSGAGAALTRPDPAAASVGPVAGRRPTRADGGPVHPEVLAIEQAHERRIGVVAHHLDSGRTLVHRPDERFAMCSTFKTLAVGAVLAGRLTSPDRRILDRPAHWPPSLVAGAGYAVRMEEWQRRGYVPRVAEVCEAAVAESDNAAGNLLLGLVGGPAAVGDLARSVGDRITTLTRWEPDLNVWEPGSTVDTTTPRAAAHTHGALLLGPTLRPRERARLLGWLRSSTTGRAALRAGLPRGWRVAEKTGSGDYGTRNDVGVAWTPDGSPVVIACLTRAEQPGAPTSDAPLADVGRLCARLLG